MNVRKEKKRKKNSWANKEGKIRMILVERKSSFLFLFFALQHFLNSSACLICRKRRFSFLDFLESYNRNERIFMRTHHIVNMSRLFISSCCCCCCCVWMCVTEKKNRKETAVNFLFYVASNVCIYYASKKKTVFSFAYMLSLLFLLS